MNTRLRKLDKSNDYDGLILAVAGIERMGWQDRISHVSLNGGHLRTLHGMTAGVFSWNVMNEVGKSGGTQRAPLDRENPSHGTMKSVKGIQDQHSMDYILSLVLLL